MTLKICILFCFLQSQFVVPIQVDQRQNGELNVQVDFRDVQIIALLNRGKEDYVNYDYAYDYSELTVKPPKPLNGTNSSTTTLSLSETTTVATTFDENLNNNTQLTTKQGPTSEETIFTTLKTITENTTESIDLSISNATSVSTTSTTEIPNCKKGFVLNSKGECQMRLNGTENALLKLVKLSQKLKLRRENKSNDE